MTGEIPPVAPTVAPALSIEERMARLERAIGALAQQAARPAAPAAPADPMTQMATAWQIFSQVQAGAQNQVQQNYEFMRRLATDAAANQAPGNEWAPIAAAVTQELLPAVSDFIRAKTGTGGTPASWETPGAQVITVQARSSPVEPATPAPEDKKEISAGGASP